MREAIVVGEMHHTDALSPLYYRLYTRQYEDEQTQIVLDKK